MFRCSCISYPSAGDVRIYQDIGRRVAALRVRCALSQEALAERAQISVPYLARIEAGDRRPTVEVLARVAAALGCPTWRLFTDDRKTRTETLYEGPVLDLAEAVRGLEAGEVQLLAAVARSMGGRAPRRKGRGRG